MQYTIVIYSKSSGMIQKQHNLFENYFEILEYNDHL